MASKLVLGKDVLVGRREAAQLTSAFVLSRLDQRNSALTGLSQSTIAPLQRMQNAAARFVCDLGYRDHVATALKQPNWLPVMTSHVKYKSCMVMHYVHSCQAPTY